jgi:fermentation-respiration switch protein FrsA (DUF1100 family)
MPRLALAVCLASALLAGACVERVPLPQHDPLERFAFWFKFYDTPIEIHFSKPPNLQPGTPLLLYATGDGGWRGQARDIFEHLVHWGYPAAGFSAVDYVRHIGYVSGTTTPERLGRDYLRLIAFARRSLGLPDDTPTILVGVSRGAGLAVVAATQEPVRRELVGVLAVALVHDEEYVRHYRIRRGQPRGDTPRRELVTFDNYEALALLSSLPVEVIQSTRDNYLPAADARQLFGPDSEFRRLHPIEARNHNFKGGRAALFDQMVASLQWIRSVNRSRRTAASGGACGEAAPRRAIPGSCEP